MSQWVADDFAALILVTAVAASMTGLVGLMIYRGMTNPDLDTKGLREVWIALLAVVSALIGFLFGQSGSG